MIRLTSIYGGGLNILWDILWERKLGMQNYESCKLIDSVT